jgi:hypothetical protein
MRKPIIFVVALLFALPGAFALYPVVKGAGVTDSATSGTSYSVDVPAAEDGDLLLMFFTSDGVGVPSSTGWDVICSQSRSTFATAHVLAKRADGTEGSSVTVGNTVDEAFASITYRIRKGSWHGQVAGGIDCATADPGGTTASPDPPSLSTDWQVAENTWFAYFGSSTNTGVTTYPSGFVNGQHVNSGTGTSNAAAQVAWYKERTQTVNPGTFSDADTVSGGVVTIAVKPSPIRPAIADLENDLILRYSFTPAFTTASTVADSSGNSVALDTVSGTWNSADTSWEHTSGQKLSRTTNTIIDYRNGFTACTWANMNTYGVVMGSESSGSNYAWKLSVGNSSGNSVYDLQIWDDGSTEYSCRWFSGCTSDITNPVPAQTWTHLCMTANYEDDKALLYTNGIITNNWTFAGDKVEADEDHFFAGWGVSGGGWDGAIDDVRLYDRDIGYFGVRELYRQGRAANDEGCNYVGYGDYSVDGELLCNQESIDLKGNTATVLGDGEVTIDRVDGAKQVNLQESGVLSTNGEGTNFCSVVNLTDVGPLDDESGNNNDVTTIDAAWINQSNGYGFYYCDGVNDYIEGDAVTTDYTSSDVISTHFKVQPGQVAFQSVLVNRFNYGANEGYNLFVDGSLSGLSEAVVVYGVDFYYGGEDCQYAIDSWNSVTHTFNGSSGLQQLYVNNCLAVDNIITGKNGNNGNNDLRLCNEYGSQLYEGGVDDVAFWYGRELSADEAEVLHNGSLLTDMTTNLEVLWRFNNYTDKQVCDGSGFEPRLYRTTDRSGSDHDFMNYRAVQRDDGKFFQDSVDSSLYLSSALGAGDPLPSYTDTQPITYMFIVKHENCNVRNYINHLYSYGSSNGYDLRPTNDFSASECDVQWISPQGIFHNGNSSRRCAVGEWCSVVASFDGDDRLQMWVDGFSVRNSTAAYGRNSTGNTVIIGSEGTAFNNWDGTMARATILYRNVTDEDRYNFSYLLPVADAEVDLHLWDDNPEFAIE